MRNMFKFCVLFSVFSCICIASENRNMLRNGSFEAGRDGWMFDAKPLDGEFEIDNGIAKIVAGSNCRKMSLVSEWLPLTAGDNYLLALKLRSEKQNTPVTISVWSWADAEGKWNKKTESKQKIIVGDKWQTFSLKANLEKSRMDKYQVAIESWSEGTIYVDDVVLLQGGEVATDYFSYSDVEMGLECSKQTCLFDITENPQAKLCFYNSRKKAVDVEFNVNLTDIEDKTIFTATQTITALPKKRVDKLLNLPVDKKGYYKLVVNASYAGNNQSADFAFAVIDKNIEPAVEEGYFGVCMASHNLERQLKRARQIGINNTRVHESLNWARIEKVQGEYVWPDSAGFEAYKKLGLNVLVYFDGIWQGEPAWAKKLDKAKKLELYADFCAECIKHYKGVIEDFEIVNEPWGHIDSDEYLATLKAVYAKAKAANPAATLAAVTGYHGPQIDFVKKMVDNGSLDYMDVFTLHPYPRPSRPEPVLVDIFNQSNQWLDSKGWNKPIWITEMGWTTGGKQLLPTRIPRPAARNNTELERAMYLVRANIISIANGVDRIYWFYYAGDNNFYYSYDMFECDSNDSVMKTVPVYSAMTSRLRGYKFEQTLCEGTGGVYAYMFTNGQDRQIVAFSGGDVTSDMLVDDVSGELEMYDMTGNVLASPEMIGTMAVVPLSGKPVYIEFKDTTMSPQVISFADVKLVQKDSKLIAKVDVMNVFSDVCELELGLSLPDNCSIVKPLEKSVKLTSNESKSLNFAFDVNPVKDMVSDDVTISVEVALEDKKYSFNIVEPFVYSKPLVEIDAEILIEAKKYTSSTFEPDPLWQPDSLRTYSSDGLLLRRTKTDDKKEYVLRYRFRAKQAGVYNLLFACTPFEVEDNMSWSINGGQFIDNDTSQELGKNWAYSSHPNIWWRFSCGWNNMGKATLRQGMNKLAIRFDKPVDADYGYSMLDVVAFISDIKLDEFEAEIVKLEN